MSARWLPFCLMCSKEISVCILPKWYSLALCIYQLLEYMQSIPWMKYAWQCTLIISRGGRWPVCRITINIHMRYNTFHACTKHINANGINIFGAGVKCIVPYYARPFPILALTHWGWVMHKCISKVTIIGSDNGLSPGRRQAINWTNVGILSIGCLGTNFSEILLKIPIFSFKKMQLKMLFWKWRPFCHSLNVLISRCHDSIFGDLSLWVNTGQLSQCDTVC